VSPRFALGAWFVLGLLCAAPARAESSAATSGSGPDSQTRVRLRFVLPV
jgi:hypothetical protein